MSDLIKRADAIEAMCAECLREHCETECLCGCSFKDVLSALPSAEAVSLEEHVKALNDLAVAWKKQTRCYLNSPCPYQNEDIEVKEPSTDLISRADAIQRLERLKVTYPHADISMPIDLAIETLQNLTEPNKSCEADIISRTEAIDAVCEQCEWERKCHETCQHIETLSALPSAEAEPTQAEKCEECIHNGTNKDKITCKECASAEAVQGEWGHMIADGKDGSHWYEYECSHCGEVVLRPYNFCPNCGAIMYIGGEDTTGESL